MPRSPETRPGVILASGSIYKQQLLRRLLAEFSCAMPEVDEAPLADEAPAEMAARLARLKAEACRQGGTNSLIIGSDQVPALGTNALRKPGTRSGTIDQLRRCAGQTVRFFTAVFVAGPGETPPERHLDVTTVRYRRLSRHEIERYVDQEKPFDCAGGFKAEKLGIALVDAIETADPTAIQGLPLIWLAACLSRRGVPIF